MPESNTTPPPTATPGSYDWVPARRIEEHIRELIDHGFSRAEIARLADVDPNTVVQCGAGNRRHLRKFTAEKILAVTADRDHEKYRPWPFQRRVMALQRIQWTQREIATAAGLTTAELRQVLLPQRALVTSTQLNGIKIAYAKLKDTLGAREQVRLLVRREGWPPPAGWTEEELDDLDPLTTDRVKARWKQHDVSTPGELLYDLVEGADYTLIEVAGRLGVSEASIRSWVADRTYPRVQMAKKLAGILGVEQLPTPLNAAPKPYELPKGQPAG